MKELKLITEDDIKFLMENKPDFKVRVIRAFYDNWIKMEGTDDEN